MRQNVISRLRSQNPVTTAPSAPTGLFERITREMPDPEAPSPGRSRLRSRLGRTIAFGLAGLLVCAGVAWSASGDNPVAVVIKQVGNRLLPPEPGTNVFVTEGAPLPRGLSLVSRPDENTVEHLPAFTLEMLQIQQISHRQEDLDRVETDADFERLPLVIRPEFIRAVGEAELPSGETVSVVAVQDEICACWLRVEEAMCGSDRSFVNKGIYQFGDFSGRQGPWDILGLVDDRVASVSAWSHSVNRRTRVESNVFELRNLPKYDVTLIAYDRSGRELYRNFFR